MVYDLVIVLGMLSVVFVRYWVWRGVVLFGCGFLCCGFGVAGWLLVLGLFDFGGFGGCVA